MRDRDRAVVNAQAVLDTWAPPEVGGRWMVVRELVEQHPMGWLCYWDDQKRVRNGDRRFALAGNFPLFVDGNDFTVHSVGIDIHGFFARYSERVPERQLVGAAVGG